MPYSLQDLSFKFQWFTALNKPATWGPKAIFRYYAGWADKVHGETIPTDGEVMTI